MKLTFFGSSHGVPEPNRKCACTLIEASGRYYFIDMGMMAMEELVTRGIPVDKVKGIFVTHMHGDHTNGLISFADLISWYFKTADPVIFLPVMEAAQLIDSWLVLNGSGRALRYEEIKQGTIFDDGVLKVTAFLTRHTDKSYAFLVEAEGKKVLFTGDLKNPAVDFPGVCREQEIDLAICEAAHFPASEYETVLKGSKIKKVCINHFVPWHIPGIQQLTENMGKLPVFMANDGMEIQV